MAKGGIASPNLDSVSTINEDGSRRTVHPHDSEGRFRTWRRAFALLLLAVYIGLPWIQIGGAPAVLFHIGAGQIYLFGFSYGVQDMWLLFFVVTGLAFSLFFVTALFGRLWCGWACPYTIFLEHVYRRIERWTDGDGPARRALDAAPWRGQKAVRRAIKYALYLAATLVITHIFLSYFVPLPELWTMMHQSPLEHWHSFAVVAFLTVVFLFCFGWFREQFCIILCPYGRLQSALTDDNTMVIGYDERRGEPRGKATDPSKGDCIDCHRCVQVCPTGIDIRNGLQLECIGCAACVDACDTIMDKVGRPRGLVRYDSLRGLEGGETRWWRGRIALYSILMVVGLGAMVLSLLSLRPFEMRVAPFGSQAFYLTDDAVRNQYVVTLTNKKAAAMPLELELAGLPLVARVTGLEGGGIELEPWEQREVTVVVEIPKESYRGERRATLTARRAGGGEVRERELSVKGPPPYALER